MKLTKAATTAVCFLVICALPAIGSTSTNSSSSPFANCTWSPDRLRSDTTSYKINVFGQYANANCSDMVAIQGLAQLTPYGSIVCNSGRNLTSLDISDNASCANWVTKGLRLVFPELDIDPDLCGRSYPKNVTTSCTVYLPDRKQTSIYITTPFDVSQAWRAQTQIYRDFPNDTAFLDGDWTDVGPLQWGKVRNVTILQFPVNHVADLQDHSRKMENAWPGLEFNCQEKNETLLLNVTESKSR